MRIRARCRGGQEIYTLEDNLIWTGQDPWIVGLLNERTEEALENTPPEVELTSAIMNGLSQCTPLHIEYVEWNYFDPGEPPRI